MRFQPVDCPAVSVSGCMQYEALKEGDGGVPTPLMKVFLVLIEGTLCVGLLLLQHPSVFAVCSLTASVLFFFLHYVNTVLVKVL